MLNTPRGDVETKRWPEGQEEEVEKRFVSISQKLGKGSRALACFALVGIAAWTFSVPSPAAALDAPTPQALAGLKVWQTHNCAACHSGFATGGTDTEHPVGPNLRRTKLDREAMRETIACGRASMPSHLEGAYEKVECYGMPLGAVPDGQDVGVQMTSEELDNLVDFLFTYVVNVKLTRDVCAVWYDGNKDAPACKQFPE